MANKSTTEKSSITFASAVDFIGKLATAIKYGGDYTVSLGPYASSLKVTRGSSASTSALGKVLLYGGIAVGAVLLIVILKD